MNNRANYQIDRKHGNSEKSTYSRSLNIYKKNTEKNRSCIKFQQQKIFS